MCIRDRDEEEWPVQALSEQEIQEAVDAQFGEYSDGYLDLDQFTVMLGQQPWREIVPKEHKNQLLMEAAKVKAEADEYSRIRTMPSPAAQAMNQSSKPPSAKKTNTGQIALRVSKELFEQADEDGSGFIDHFELGTLVAKLCAKLGVRVTPSMQQEFDSAVQIQMDQARGDGIFFVDFVKMLGRKPWRDVLPEDVISGIPKALMMLLKTDEGSDLLSQRSQSAAGSVVGIPSTLNLGPKKSPAPKQSPGAAPRFEPSERRAAPVRAVYPKSHQPLAEMVHAIRQVFMTADANEDGALDMGDIERLAWQVWDISGQQPLDPRAELDQIMNKFSDKDGLVGFDQFSQLVYSTPDWKELLPENLQRGVPGHGEPPNMFSKTAARSETSPQRERALDRCYGSPGLPTNHRAAAFQSLRATGEAPIRIMRHTDPEDEMEELQPIQQSPNKIRTAVHFRRAPKTQVNTFAHKIPGGSKKSYKTMMGEASQQNQQGDITEVDTVQDLALIAKRIYKSVDVDKNGMIDTNELALALQHVWAELGKSSLLTTPSHCKKQAAKTMELWGDRNGFIGFPNFVRILLTDPWRALLPAKVQDKANFFLMKLASKPKKTASEKLVGKLEKLFGDVDGNEDGMITHTEFELLMYAVWEEVGVSPPNKEHLFERACSRIFGPDKHEFQYSDQVTCHQFVQLMCEPPFVHQLPRNLQDDLRMHGRRMTTTQISSSTSIEQQPASPVQGPGSQSLGPVSPPSTNAQSPQKTFDSTKRRPVKWRHSRTVGELSASGWRGGRIARPTVRVFPNDGGDSQQSFQVLLYSFESLLHDATVALNSSFGLKRVFTLAGVEIFAMDDISADQNLVISGGNNFVPREGYAIDAVNRKGSSPTRRRKVNEGTYMPCMRASKNISPDYTGIPPEKDESFLRALKFSPSTTGEPLLDNILDKMKKFYLENPSLKTQRSIHDTLKATRS
eukprot:TRINITY_DN7900_c0_g1_i3.p1 TRINITY_DN7900_c0_g1~~TRINITY_DN7900_c0_g1_i3.p1  ORF type:complete len:959 (-),score=220.79 TRINITY_DN7900_c0_g1_i3:517-3393(-)